MFRNRFLIFQKCVDQTENDAVFFLVDFELLHLLGVVTVLGKNIKFILDIGDFLGDTRC